MFQAIPHWPSPFSSMRHMERNESSKCWTSFSVRLGSTTTLRAPADELQGSTLPPAAPQPIPCCGPTSCPAETFTVWVQGCLCGGSDQCTAEEKYYVWHCTVDMTTMRMLCVFMRQCCSDKRKSRRRASAGSRSTRVPLWSVALLSVFIF